MEFGVNPSSFLSQSFVDFSGSDTTTPTIASLTANLHGWTPTVQFSGTISGSLTYAAAASKRLLNATGVLNDGGNYSDASTTGLQYSTSGSVTTWIDFNGSIALLPLSDLTAGLWVKTNHAPLLNEAVDMLVIQAQGGSTEFMNAMSFGNGAARYFSLECSSGQNHAADYVMALNTWYWIELVWHQGAPHALKIYSDANPPVLLNTQTCASLANQPAFVELGNLNGAALTGGYVYDYDSLKISLDATDPLLP
jgi:hypothetical protein